MKKYLVVWQGDHHVIQSEVTTSADGAMLSANEWVELAALSEGYDDDEIAWLLEDGYSLFLVCDFPTELYV